MGIFQADFTYMILNSKKQPKNRPFSMVNERFLLKLSAIGTLLPGMGIYHLEGVNSTGFKIICYYKLTIYPNNHS